MVKRKAKNPSKLAPSKQATLSWNGLENFPTVTPAPSLESITPSSSFQESTQLEDTLGRCLFYIRLYENIEIKNDKCIALIGNINLTFIEDVPLELKDCYFYVNELSEKSYIYCHVPQDVTKTEFVEKYYEVLYNFDIEALFCLKRRTKSWFHVVYERHCSGLNLNVYLLEKALVKLNYPSEIGHLPVKNVEFTSSVQKLISLFFGIPMPEEFDLPNEEVKENISAAYELINDRGKVLEKQHLPACVCNPDEVKDLDHSKALCKCQRKLPHLIPELRKYQREAINWMLSVENSIYDQTIPTDIHPLFNKLTCKNGTCLYFNKIEAFFASEKPLAVKMGSAGILADEMGLGKTIEVISCIISHQRSVELACDAKELVDGVVDAAADEVHILACVCGCTELKSEMLKCTQCHFSQHPKCVNYVADDAKSSKYLCPHCCVLQVIIPSRATLIISPSSICAQWVEELERHTTSGLLKTLVYTGVNKMGFIQPQTLTNYDVIICTYETLRRELNYASLPHCNSSDGRKLRNPKRFMTTPSPLVCVEFWRICLDEAQMIECTTSKTAEMVSKLCCVHRWCVSGTPIQQSLDDLYGLMLFLRGDPFFVKRYFHKLIKLTFRKGNMKPLQDLLHNYMWRSTKKAVIDQIQIPEQKEIIHWLEFSPVETHFYQTEYSRCKMSILNKLNQYERLDVKLSSLDRRNAVNLMQSLRTLRQACCHPQVVRGQFIPIRKSVITMEEILKSLIKKTVNAAEELHRNLIAAYNGIAGIYIIKEEYESAVEAYRNVLKSIDENKDKLKSDKLQKLHTLHNLASVLDIVADNQLQIGRTLRDENLRQEADQLRNDYLNKSLVQVTQSKQTLTNVHKAMKELNFNISTDSKWWMQVLSLIHKHGWADDFINRLKDNYAVRSINQKYNDVFGLHYVLITALDDLEVCHRDLKKSIITLPDSPNIDVVNQAVECHLRPVKNSKAAKCIYCKIHKLFESYENKLFSFIEKKNNASMLSDDEDEEEVNPLWQAQRRGTWADSQTEVVIKYILNFVKQHYELSEFAEPGSRHVKFFEMLKKEFRALRSVWMQRRDYVAAIDELDMATTRLRLKYPNEPDADPPMKHIIEAVDVATHQINLSCEQTSFLSRLQKKLGQLYYLQNLEKSESGCEGGVNPELCPICQKALGMQWAILQCGHCFCTECIRILINDFSFGFQRNQLKCAICRSNTSHADINYVVTNSSKADQLPDTISVQGSHSTKVEHVIRCVKKIHMDDPDAKTLIFSSWKDVLQVLSKALEQNSITYEFFLPGTKYLKSLASFKVDPNVKVLLLLVKSGSKGLNLINATNVILVEPLLNMGHERQAVGRVHRIGQTKPTFVHKFLIKGTIEENISQMQEYFEENNDKANEQDVITLQQLKDLFEHA